MMNKLCTLLLAAACFTASAQSESSYPFNPDFDGDGWVGVNDVLGFLSFYDQPQQVQTCFKGELCYFISNGQPKYTTGMECGTIIVRTMNFNGNNSCDVHIENAGYTLGDVIHLYHGSNSYYSTSAKFFTLVDGVWTSLLTLSGSGNEDHVASIIFTGSHWEPLN